MPVVLILVTWLAVATQPAVGLLLSPYLQIQQQQKQPWMNRRRQSALLFGGGGSSDTIPRVPIAPLGNEGFTSPTPTAELLEEPAQLLRRNPILLSGEDIQRQMEAELARLQIKDALSPKLAPEVSDTTQALYTHWGMNESKQT